MKPYRPIEKMNNTEKRYAVQLGLMKRAGQILGWSFEGLNFRLADRTYFKPDFLVVFPDRFEIHEVKGFWRDDARVKIKVAAKLYPWFKWVAVQWKKKQWVYEKIN